MHRDFNKASAHTVALSIGVTVVVGAVVLAVARGSLVLPSALHVGLWLALVGLAYESPVPLPKRRTEASLLPVVEFAAVLAFQPVVACGLTLVWGVVALVAQRWSHQCFRWLGSTLVSVGCAGLTYRMLGGRPGVLLDSEPGSGFLLPTVVSAAVYLVARHGLAVWDDAARKPRWAGSSLRELTDRAIWDALLLPCAVLLAIVHLRIGVVGTSLFFIPLILARHLGRVWNHGKRAQLEAVRTLMQAVDAADPFTRGHSHRVSKMCVAIGKRLGLSPQELEELEYASLLHDIGRTAIHHEILVKPGELTRDERNILRTHPRLGRDILDRIGFFPRASEIVYSHHEQPNGGGYPEGLSKEAVPIGSRIIMVVAAFDAMTSDRPYRRGLDTESAFEELLAHGGTQFYSDVVQALIELYADGHLFDEFDQEVLQAQAGEGSSRALEEYMRRSSSTLQELETVVDPAEIEDDGEPANFDWQSTRSGISERVHLTEDGWKVTVAALSDVGRVRDNNEDAFGIFADERVGGCLLVVADGMGGEAAGEVASEMAVETVRSTFLGDLGSSVGPSLRDAISKANEMIHARAAKEPQYEGMGTTCVAAFVSGSELTVAHVGDSRAYLVDAGSIEQLTKDHTLAEQLMSVVGSQGPRGAEHVLTRSLGGGAEVEVDISRSIPLSDGKVLVLCSDGLFNVVDRQEIRDVVLHNRPAVACRDLVDAALRRGGPDNVSIVVARIESS